MQHEVHAADAQHGHAGVAVVAGERLALREFPLLRRELAAGQAVRPALLVIAEVALIGVRLKQMLPRVDEEAARAGGGIDDTLARLGVDHLHHHADDVARRAELAVGAGGVESAQEVLVEIALHVLVLRGDLHLIDRLAGFDEQARLVDLELGGRHVLAEGAGFVAEFLEEWEDLFLDGLQAPCRQATGSSTTSAVLRIRERAVRTFCPRFLAARSASCSRSSSCLRKKRNESCSIASRGLERPPVQSLSQRLSTCERSLVSASITIRRRAPQ